MTPVAHLRSGDIHLMTTDHHDPRNGSHESDARWAAFGEDGGEEADFWGDQADWPTAAIPVVSGDRDEQPSQPSSQPPRAHRAATSAATSAGMPAGNRRHREVAPAGAVSDDRSVDHAVSITDDTPVAPVWDDRWSPAAPPRSGGVDPRLFRLGAAAIIITLLVPVVVGFRSRTADDLMTLATAEAAARSDADAPLIEDVAPGASAEVAASTTVAPEAATAGAASTADAPEPTAPAEIAASAAETDDDESSDPASDSGSASTESGAADGGAESAVVAEQVCAVDYEVRGGDFWLRLADGAGVELAELLEANDATVDTPLYPGRTICLPAGSKTPPPPPASNTGSAGSANGSSGGSSSGSSGGSSGNSQPAPTAAPRPAPTTPPTPPTTAAPTTTAPPPPPPPPAPAQVEQIIRNVWPDDLEDKALRIAWRESNYQADVRNYCCYGLFQIYWSVHQSWLRGMGVNSAYDLYDAETNTRAAYALYQRAGGWGPWGG
jgi:hypothetical protein